MNKRWTKSTNSSSNTKFDGKYFGITLKTHRNTQKYTKTHKRSHCLCLLPNDGLKVTQTHEHKCSCFASFVRVLRLGMHLTRNLIWPKKVHFLTVKIELNEIWKATQSGRNDGKHSQLTHLCGQRDSMGHRRLKEWEAIGESLLLSQRRIKMLKVMLSIQDIHALFFH